MPPALSQLEFGFQLPNGTQIIHGEGSMVKAAFPADANIPGQLQVFGVGNKKDENVPLFGGSFGCLPFDTQTRMPRHVHMTEPQDDAGHRAYVVERILVLNGVAIMELGGEIYVVPPKTVVSIGRGVPHTWTACPPGLDLQKLGVCPPDQEKIVSDGQFLAVFEYDSPTSFFPTKQVETLKHESDYQRCDDLHSIRIPEYSVDELLQHAWFIWGRKVQKFDELSHE